MENYAGFWLRVGAYIIDAIILSVVQWIIFSIFGISMMGAAGSLDPATSDAVGSSAGLGAYGISILVGLAYFVYMESSDKQATFGKMAVGIIVTDLQGNRITPGRALGRYLGKILSGMILLIGYIMVAFTERKQGLHDILAGTLVLKAKPGEVGVDPSVFE